MTTPPRVERDQADAAIERIIGRRAQIDDPHRELLSDDPREVLSYLRKHSGPAVPAWVRAADVADGLLLKIYLWWEIEGHEAWLLTQGRDLLHLTDMGKILGIRSRQGVQNRITYKRQLFAYPGEHVPQPRTADAIDQRLAAMMPGRDPRQPWLDRHRTEIDRLAGVLLEHRHLGDDDAYESLGYVADDRKDRVHSPGSFSQLVSAAAELALSPAVSALEAGSPLGQALSRLDDLHTAWARLPDREPAP